MFGTFIHFSDNDYMSFDMKKNRLFSLLLFLLVANSMFAQLGKAVREILTGDSAVTHITVRNDSDSIRMANMKRELEEARLNEANMRMEMEQLRLKAFAADSVKLAQQKARIDSLRQFTPGVPVVVEGDTLFYLYTKRGGYTPLQRAEMIDAAITQLGRRFTLHPDSVYIESSDIVSDLMYGNKVIASFTDQDGLWEGRSREQLAADKRIVVVKKLKELKEEHSFWQLGKRILYFVLVLVGQYLLFRLTTWLFRKLKVRIQKLKDTKLKPISIQDYELLDTQRQVNLLIFLSNLLRYVLVFLQLLITVPLLFVIFPQTKGLADTIFSYIWNPVKDILVGIVDYIPNLFTIFIIWYAIKYLVRFVHYLSREIEAGRLKFGGFIPTGQCLLFILSAFCFMHL